MEKNSLLNEVTHFSKVKLNPTTTKVSYANGKQFTRSSKDAEEKELVGDTSDEFKSMSNVAYWSKATGYVVDLVPDNSIDEIMPRLYLSGDDAATNRALLDSKCISHVINLTSNVENKFEPIITYKQILIYDLPNQNIMEHFQSSYEFIENAFRQNEKNCVLVHCNAGVSRSATIVIAYLMQKKLFRYYRDAFEYVKAKRPKICPNYGFVKQLMSLQIKLNT